MLSLRIAACFAAVVASAFTLAAQAPVRATAEDGRRVLLLPDGTWKYEAATSTPAPAGAPRRKSAAATTKIEVPFGDATFWIDASKWKEQSHDGGRMGLTHTNGKYFGLVVSEALGAVPTSAMKTVALTNAKNLDPNARVVTEERRVVNGRDVVYLELGGTGQNIPFRFAGVYHR